MFNASAEPVTFHTPVAPDKGRWWLAADTSHEDPLAGPTGFVDSLQAYALEPRSSAVLVAR
jgi:hypothetical protein